MRDIYCRYAVFQKEEIVVVRNYECCAFIVCGPSATTHCDMLLCMWCVVAKCWRDIKIRTQKCASLRSTDVCDNGLFMACQKMPLVSFCTNMINIWSLSLRSTDTLTVTQSHSERQLYACLYVLWVDEWVHDWMEKMMCKNACSEREILLVVVCMKNLCKCFDTKQEKWSQKQ